MTIHYHGLPLTPEVMLLDLAGRHVCISYATQRPRQVEICLRRMQGIMFDNGAFSAYQAGVPFDVPGFYKWVDQLLGHPHWAVIPDVIDGTVEQQRGLVRSWPFPRELGAPVWHLAAPIDYLLELADSWPRICLGSSGAYWQVGSPAWCKRMDEATEALFKRRTRAPWLHGLRMMAQAGKRWPVASVDSVNVALNYKDREEMPGFMAQRIDSVNNATIRVPAPAPVPEVLPPPPRALVPA